MARPLRIEFEGALYHVMACGNAQADIFLDDEGFARNGQYHLYVVEQIQSGIECAEQEGAISQGAAGKNLSKWTSLEAKWRNQSIQGRPHLTSAVSEIPD